MGKRDAIDIHLRFDRKKERWEALVQGEVYATHRFERRTLALGVQAYAKAHGLNARTLEYNSQIDWPTKVSKIHDIWTEDLQAYEEGLDELRVLQEQERVLKAEIEAKKLQMQKTCGQYVAALVDFGMSRSGAISMVQVTNNTITEYFSQQGGIEAAAEKMWRRAGVKIKGTLTHSGSKASQSTPGPSKRGSTWQIYQKPPSKK